MPCFCCFLHYQRQKLNILISLTSGGRAYQGFCKNCMRNQNNSMRNSQMMKMWFEALTNPNESVQEGQTPDTIKISL
ncbi:hypothetical protein OIU74_027131 [Salix koriyanagi]|uniref:Uncharacterized protein n=1 Tax=Salix koriyanagi TaxID=2511006 RepID=A0A9Q0W0W7_9ROSI|nr:hypothetical protein OIU74_027131 [Salix koriyanagi]